jgi:signal transduction histidine kinase
VTYASLLRRHVFDALVVLLAVVAEIKVWIVPWEGPKAVFIVGSLLWTLPLLLRRRLPFAAPVFAFAVQTAVAFADPTLGAETTSFAAVLLAFWVVGAHNERSQATAGAVIGFAAVALIVRVDVGLGLEEAVSVILFGGIVCLVAYALQRPAKRAAELQARAGRLEREREERERTAVAEERRRIARELHDVIAHSVTLMTVQAGAARLLLAEEPQRAREPIASVEETGRQALADIRRLLGILHTAKSEVARTPQPGLARLEALIGQARDSGLPVELTVEGERKALPPGVDLAAYRIVQEALTNARRHAVPARARVAIHYRPEALELAVMNDGPAASNTGGGGHGLVGMRERTALYGGELEAGPHPEGGYQVRARLPLEAAET